MAPGSAPWQPPLSERPLHEDSSMTLQANAATNAMQHNAMHHTTANNVDYHSCTAPQHAAQDVGKAARA
eukprot:CAMPEP_0196804460 /NCGR_PEP_ID=MMETSP1362-20130617/4063_1 /TAXON_ID=163516 /ORGANISM="Leptocylindrus danicus, Strain CCMP1856" /LENGTH=68 /DNA_ID=CAMNT_0042176767 /DNA_START=107 /DNA_END=313 /DNA_ORIENTATION=-